MCGIAGIIDLKTRRPINESLLAAMNDRLQHRGPDGSGLHVEPGIGLAHRRLSIVDLAAGHQPMYNEDNSVCIVFNGEIYNFQGLVQELTALGHQFRTRCDTEVIIHAWEQWGTDCLSRFNGMFAFALWDRNRQQVFLARDRLGVKPLFTATLADGTLLFASELKSLLLHPDLPRNILPRAIEDYLTFGYVPEPDTIYSGIKKLEPGHLLLVDRSGQQTIQRYWDLDTSSFCTSRLSEADARDELLQRLTEAVRRRLLAEVPLGAFLSGGVDSSAVVAIMAGLMKESVKTCSIGFNAKDYDESAYARQVASLYRTDHSEHTVEVDDFGLLETLVGLYDEPYADSSAIPTYRVCAAARERVTVALSGDAGDEDFAGYRRYRLFAAEESIRNIIPAAIRRPVFGLLGRYYPKLDWAPRIFRGKTTFQGLARDSVGAYLHGVSLSSRETRSALYSPAFRSGLQGYDSRAVFDRHVRGRDFPDALSMVQYLDLKTYLVGDILTKVDRASMAHSLEVRGPFLDYEFIEWAATLPTSLKLRGGVGKYVLKKSLETLLPKEILYRKKMGFAVPLARWFRGPLKDRVRALPNSPWLNADGIFERRGLEQMVSQHLSGQRDFSPGIWSLLMLEGFLRSPCPTYSR
ncbi:MAG: amidotransferase 1, exosortase A system-associated [Gammaproteobacteria bacterium]|jgi:asparagine synthase (glutamine-hydrolysing)|nr:amidotransferase 1, exosortase A system-associated [Gammaproteobacteria bacterium]